MKIGLITGEYPPQQGGVGDFTRELALALTVAGHEAHVITCCGKHAGGNMTAREDGIIVHRVISSWGIACWKQVANVASHERFDVLNIQYEPAAYAMFIGVNFLPSVWIRRKLNTPIVTTFHDLLVPYLFPKAGSLRWKVVEYLAYHSDAAIVTNDEDRARLSNLDAKSPISSLQVVPIGSNIDPASAGKFDRAAERTRWGIQPTEQLLGYFGFLNLSKGGSDLMQALRILSDRGMRIKLLLIGGRIGSSDPANAEYAAQVERLIELLGVKDRVITTGYLGPQEVSQALLTCDALVLPYVDGASLRRGSLLAAIAHGRAIVTTEPLYPIEGLQHEVSVVYVPPSDPPALADSVQRVLQDAALRHRLQTNVSETAKLYTWDRIALQTAEVLEGALRRARHAMQAT